MPGNNDPGRMAFLAQIQGLERQVQDLAMQQQRLWSAVLQLAVPADAKLVFGRGTVEWTGKAFASQKELIIATGFTTIQAAVAVAISSESFAVVGTIGGQLNVAAVGRLEQVAGTKVDVFYLAIGS